MLGIIAGVAGSVLGGVMAAQGAKSAAKTQAKSADQAAQLQYDLGQQSLDQQQRMFDQQRADAEPYRYAGTAALNHLMQRTSPWFGDFKADPGYRFRLSEGQDALNRQASATGMRMSGAALKDANNYAQGQASQEYGNWWNRSLEQDNSTWNRLAGLAGVGQTAVQQVGSAGQNYANAATNINQSTASGVGNALLSAGNARASGYQGAASAWGNALGGIGATIGAAQAGYFGQNPGFGIKPYSNPYTSTNFGSGGVW